MDIFWFLSADVMICCYSAMIVTAYLAAHGIIIKDHGVLKSDQLTVMDAPIEDIIDSSEGQFLPF